LLPEEFSEKHPHLFHITRKQVLPSILKHGLLPASGLLRLCDLPEADCVAIETTRRAQSLEIHHEQHGTIVLTDNKPLSTTALAKCLDDGLLPEDWMKLLNGRVFFWADQDNLEGHLKACRSDGVERVVLVIDSLEFTRALLSRVELAAINTGSTIRSPARRGLDTFTPMARYGYRDWQKLRGHRDRLKEVCVVGAIPDMKKYIVEYR
jgi:hypothetical protein